MHRTIDIPRVSKISREALEQEYLSGEGRPVIITDGLAAQPAFTKWTFEYFSEFFGDDVVELSDHIDRPRVQRMVELREYLQYVVDPESSRLHDLSPKRALYAFGYQPFDIHPELLDDIKDPYCLENWLSSLGDELRTLFTLMDGSPAGRWIFIGPRGTRSTFHTDYTAAWLGQITGMKRCALVAPRQGELCYDGAVDPFDPDFERCPGFADATVHTGIMQPGDILLMPHGWWHHVEALSASITASFNFLTASSLDRFFTELVRDLPMLSDVFDVAPALRGMMGVKWRADGFSAATKRDLSLVA